MLLSEDCAFDTDGSSITAADWVIVAGNAMNDIAIPVSTPYALNASKLLIPDTVSCAGINIASPLWRRVRRILLHEMGRAIPVISRICGLIFLNTGRKCCPTVAHSRQKRPDVISPATIPATAITGVTGSEFLLRKNVIARTLPTRANCSNNCETAGTFASPVP